MFVDLRRLFPLLVLPCIWQALAEPLRLNSVEDAVVVPAGMNDYALMQEAGSLFVAWTERRSSEWQILLAKVDVGKREVTELFREAFADATPSSPVLGAYKSQLVMCWLQKEGSGARLQYRIETLSCELSTGEILDRESLPYGYQPKGLQLLASPRGLFVGGASAPGRREGIRFYFFEKKAEAWAPLGIPGSEESYNQYPCLAGGEKYLYLAWISDGKLNFSRSASGEEWDDLQVLSGKGAMQPSLILGEGESLSVVWSEEMPTKDVQVRLATSRDQGLTWWHASELLEVKGTRLEFDFAFNRDARTLLVYHFWDADESCEMIECCIMSSDWRRRRLDRFPDGLCGRSLKPAAMLSEDRMYVVWQERRGRRTSIAVNYSEDPWDDWLEVASQLIESEQDEALVAPKLVSLENRLFLIYFRYDKKRSLFQRNLQLGDLLLRELVGNDKTSGRFSVQ